MNERRACACAKNAAVDISARFLRPLLRHFMNAAASRMVRLFLWVLQLDHKYQKP
jgi:hypothetical protein